MVFSNRATLSYDGRQVASNTVSGTLLPMLTLAKSASVASYRDGSVITYQCVLTNTGATDVIGATLTDSFGRYDWTGGLWRFPLQYVFDSARLTVIDTSGVRPGTVSVDFSFDGMLFTFDIPAMSTVWLAYNAQTTPYAPLAAGAAIDNTASLASSYAPLSDSVTLPVAAYVDLRVAKQGFPTTVTQGQTATFRITVSNYGNTAADTTATVSDLLSPLLTDIVVTSGQTVWTQGTQYDYDPTTGLFRTLPGALSLGAARFTQNSFGVWDITPASVSISISGTATGANPPQAVVDVQPAYTDGRERFLQVTRIANDRVRLSSSGGVQPIYHVGVVPNAALSLLAPSSPCFTLQGAMLSVDPTCVIDTAAAYLGVSTGTGDAFTVRLDYGA